MSGTYNTTFHGNYRILFYTCQIKYKHTRKKFLTLEIKSSIITVE
nr:MAG TPA: hypothetical protein [Caudoviricetes sp.]